MRRRHLLLLSILCPEIFLSPAAAGTVDPPNVLVVIADDWSFGHAGVLGCDWVRTPGFDRIAREGILFERAYTPNAKCAPSRSIILTGRNSWQLEQAGNHMCVFPARFRSFMEVLGQRGYATGYTGKGWGPGVARDAAGKQRHMTGQAYQRRRQDPGVSAVSRLDYASNFEDFLDAVADNRSWCFWLGTYEPHRGYERGIGLRDGTRALSDIDRVPACWPDNDVVRTDMLDYAWEVEHFDQHLQRAIAALEAAGQLDRTLIIVTSDHGMPFPRIKGQAYESSNHVPLAIRWPEGIRGQGRRVRDYVSFADLAPTVLQAAGIGWQESGMAPSAGRGLQDIFASSASGQITPARDHVLVGKERHDVGRPNNGGYPIRGIVKDNWLYLKNYEPARWPGGNPETGYLNCDGGLTKTEVLEQRRQNPQQAPHWQLCFGKRPAEELYDLTTDPDCVTNLAQESQHQQRLTAYRTQMEAELLAQQDPRQSGQGHIFDEYPYSSPKTDRFYERYMAGEKLKAGWVNPSDFESGPLD